MTHDWRNAPYLTLTEAAEVLGVSRSKAYEMAHAGDLPTHPDDVGRLRVKPDDLEPLVAAQEADADAQPDLFTQVPPRPRTRALRRRRARAHRTNGAAWLAVVGAEAWVGPEERKVLKYLAAHSNDDGTLDDEAAALVHQALGDM